MSYSIGDGITALAICGMIAFFIFAVSQCKAFEQPTKESNYEMCIERCPTTKYKFTTMECPEVCAQVANCTSDVTKQG